MELAIGLPLIIMMLWAMSNLFAGTWKECRDLIADFTMQIEVNNAMQRIVSDLNVASYADKIKRGTSGAYNDQLEIKNYIVSGSDIILSDKSLPESKKPIYYGVYNPEGSDGRKSLYRQRQLVKNAQGYNHPITGDDLLSLVNIKKFDFEPQNDEQPWIITIEAESKISNHRYELRTKVFLGGADR